MSESVKNRKQNNKVRDQAYIEREREEEEERKRDVFFSIDCSNQQIVK